MTQNTLLEWESPPRKQSIPERFEEIVARYPDRLAVKFVKHSLSYRELNEASNRMARSLLAVTHSDSTTVALLFDRGINVIVAMIGALKAGKQVTTLDSHAPEERMKFMLDDHQNALIVTDSRFFDVAQRVAHNVRTVLHIDEIDESISSSNLGLAIAPNQTAIIAYTSGSTGQPRGVARTHQERVVGAISSSNFRKLCAEDRVSLLHSVSFGVGAGDLFMALLNGAAILPFDFASQGVLDLAKWLKDERITIFHSPPVVFRELANVEFSTNHFTDLRLIRLSGAPITQRDFELYRTKFDRGTLLEVGMGSTEIEAICNAVVDQDFSFPEEGSPVGYAREGKEVLILDDEGHELGPGEVGEITVRSRDFTSGYWRRLGLGEEKFRHDPKDADTLIYLTGDWGTCLADGFVIHRGRKDLMVKLRGYRVDFSEIERALLQHPMVKEAGVATLDRGSGDKYLVAYVVPRQYPRPTIGDLYEFLQAKLPHYMMPGTFVFLDHLPLTNGKLDRRALPLPDRNRPDVGQAYGLARSETEERVIRIWEDLLDVSPIGIHDNFFLLGGHSLLASQLVSRLGEVFRVELPLRGVFEFPTVAGLAEWIETHGAEPQDARNLSILPIPRGAEFPLSFSQEGLWFLDQLEPGSCAYNLSSVFQLKGSLNVTAMEQSLNEIIKRHEALRTVFKSVNGQPVQVILPAMTIQLSVADLRDCPSATGREAEVRRRYNQEMLEPFDLARGPLLRARLLKLEEDSFIILLIVHHIVYDGWSSGIIARELSVLYQKFCRGKPTVLPALRTQYADFAVWQRQWCEGEWVEAQLSYWKRKLSQIPPLLELPTDNPRPRVQTFRGARQAFVLSRKLSSELKRLSQQHGVTLFMTLLAAYQTLLQRYTGQNDIVIGSPVAGRKRREVEDLIGFFLNMLVLRTDLSGNPTFRELLARAREVCLEAYAHEDLPFEKLVQELQPERTLAYNPLVQVTFALQNTLRFRLDLGGATAREFDTGGVVARSDLHLFMFEEESGLEGWMCYNTDLFNADTISRLTNHFQGLLEALVANPDKRISELAMLTEAESHQLLVEWNDTKRDYPKDKCIHKSFEEQVERTADSIAVVFEDEQLTYRELNSRANQLAHYLQRLSVGPETLVAICVERSIDMIVGLLGILKAGGAYVPLDPDYPKERLAFMLEDSRAAVLLTQERLIEKLPGHSGHVVYLDEDWEKIALENSENPRSAMTGENLAYVIYTSGSTGVPKGVGIEHLQLMNYLVSITERLDLASQKSFANVSTIAADLGNTVIFPALCSGAVLHIISQDRIADAEAMAEYFSRHAIDCLKIVPSHLMALQSVSQPERIMPRHLLILGGEASDVEWVKKLAVFAPGCKIVNHYGPTETTVGVTTYTFGSDIPHTMSGYLPLGRPLANTEIHILDSNLSPVPIGVSGELYIGGLGLARGYLNHAELTAERFVRHPFSNAPLARLYKTGDRARYLPDGNIEFLGRIDNQIKRRGYRIEPGEIEATLKQHAEVREAVVLERNGRNGEKQLAAYLVVSPDVAPTVASKPRYRLPNGIAVAQLNKNETDYIYQEIFERQAYLRNGITINDGDCIFDVGANIGLFTVFANQIAKGLRIYSFEPNPAVHNILKANAKLYGSDIRLFKCGLSDKEKTATFTFFPGFSLLSGFYADAQAEKEVVKAYMLNQQKADVPEIAELLEQADAILGGRFAPESFDVELRALSSIIEQDGIEYIDLLKINAEKSELDVLLGISERDWQKIKQIVLEVDVQENLSRITPLLEKHGYEYVVEQDNMLEGTSLCYVYAIRPSLKRKLIREQSVGSHVRTLLIRDQSFLSAADMKAFLTTKLPECMIPSAFVFLDTLPLTPNGKVDRKALPAPDQSRPELGQTYSAPRTPVEELLANIWAEVLKVENVGIHDNFFDLGGHSLLATQVVSRVREAFQTDLPVRALFEAPTVAALALRIEPSVSGSGEFEELVRNLAEVELLSEKEITTRQIETELNSKTNP